MNISHNIIAAAPLAARRGRYIIHNHDHAHTSGGGVWALIVLGGVLLVIAGFVALRVMMTADARANTANPSTTPAPDTEAASTSSGGGDQQGAVATDCSESAGG